MGRRSRLLAVVLATGCGGSGSTGGAVSDDPDAAGATDGAAPVDGAAPDAAVNPFEDRAWGALETMGQGQHPEVAIDHTGAVMTLWSWPVILEEPRCIARRREIDDAWAPDVLLVTPDSVDEELAEPGYTLVDAEDFCTSTDGIAVDGAGRAAAIFWHSRMLRLDGTNAYSTRYNGMRAMFDPSVAWTTPELMGSSSLGSAAVAMSPDGKAVIVWSEPDELWETTYEPGTGWGDPARFVEEEGALFVSNLALDTDGDGTVLVDDDSHLWTSTSSGGVWLEPQQVDDPDVLARSYDLAVNGAGAAVVVWRGCLGAACVIRGRQYDPVAGWGMATTIAEVTNGTKTDNHVQVAIDEQGNGLAVWTATWPGADPDPALAISHVEAAQLRDGTWTEPEILHMGSPGDGARNPQVVLDAAGNGLVAWRYSVYWYEDAPWDPHGEYQARTYTPARGFGQVEILDSSDGQRFISWLRLAMNASGVGVAAWSLDGEARIRMFR